MYCLLEYKVDNSKGLASLFHSRSRTGPGPQQTFNWCLRNKWIDLCVAQHWEKKHNNAFPEEKEDEIPSGMVGCSCQCPSHMRHRIYHILSSSCDGIRSQIPTPGQAVPLPCYLRSCQSTSLSKTHQPFRASWKRKILLDCRFRSFISLRTTHPTPERTFTEASKDKEIICPRNDLLSLKPASEPLKKTLAFKKSSTRWQCHSTSLPSHFSHQRSRMG